MSSRAWPRTCSSPITRIDGLRASQIGTRNIDRALEDLAAEWVWKANQMANAARETAHRLRQAADRYSGVEARVSRAFGGR